MEILTGADILAIAGRRMNIPRNMSVYNGRSFRCVCGSVHVFSSYIDRRNFVSSSMNAKMLITCPDNADFTTLVKAKHKYFFVFDRFVSLAGSRK